MTKKLALTLIPRDFLEIRKRITAGERLLAILGSFEISPEDFFAHLNKFPEDKLAFEQARRVAFEMAVDDIEQVYDNVETRMEMDIANAKANHRRWMAEKLIPDTYGAKVQHDHKGTINIVGALKDASERAAKVTQSIMVDSKPLNLPSMPASIPPGPAVKDPMERFEELNKIDEALAAELDDDSINPEDLM